MQQTSRKSKRRRRQRQIRNRCIILFAILLLLVALLTHLSTIQNVIVRLGQGLVTSRTLEKEDYPQSLIDLYERNTEARQFVLDYKTKKDDNAAIDVSADVNAGEIPLFLQWDERWGYRSYGGDFLAVTGCGPTALSMVYVGLTGDTSMNPYEVAKRAEKEGYYVKGSGSEWSMMTGLASELGLSAKELGLDANLIRKKLEEGHPIICIMGPGDFTTTGHYIVLITVASDGSIEVHDIRITHFMSLFTRQQAGRIVASDLHIACSTWSSAVLLPVDSNPNRFDSRFKIGSDGRTVDDQQGFPGRFHAQSDRRSEHHRTQIERSSRTVGRNETLVALDDLDAGIDDHFNRRNRQAQAFRRGLETPRIVGNAEKTHFSVYTAEGLETLEKFDAVVQA